MNLRLNEMEADVRAAAERAGESPQEWIRGLIRDALGTSAVPAGTSTEDRLDGLERRLSRLEEVAGLG